MACDQRVVAADSLVPTLQLSTNFGGMSRRGVIEFQHPEADGVRTIVETQSASASGLKRSRGKAGRSRSTRIQRFVSNISAVSKRLALLNWRLFALLNIDARKVEEVVPQGIRGHDHPARAVPQDRDLPDVRRKGDTLWTTSS